MSDRQISNGERQNNTFTVLDLTSSTDRASNGARNGATDRDRSDVIELQLQGPLQYGDIVLLRFCEGHAICSHEDSRGPSSKLEAFNVLEGFPPHVSNIKMFSFEVQPTNNNQTGIIKYGSEIKLMHMDSRKFVTPGKGDANLDTTDTQTDSTEAENDSVDKVKLFGDSEDCKLKILNPQDFRDASEVLANHAVMFQAQGSYILKWDDSVKNLVWYRHKIHPPISVSYFAGSEFHCTIQLHYHIIYKKIKSKLHESSGSQFSKACRKHLQEKLKQDRGNPIIATISYFLNFKENQTFQVLKLLNFLCKDQDTVMQNYLREQPCTNSINLVENISVLFCTANDKIKEYLNTLIKICLGNFENQQVFVGYKICIEAINKMLKQTERDILQLRILAVSMLETLCEEIHPGTKINVQRIYTYIDVIALHHNLVDCYERRKDDVENDLAIKIYNLLKHMEDFKGINCKTVPSNHKMELKKEDEIDTFYKNEDRQKKEDKIDTFYKKEDCQKAWNYCARWSRSVEIMYRNEKVASKVYFRLHPEDEMTKKEESIVKHAVNCGAPKRRLRQFLLGMESIKDKVHPLNGIFQHRLCPLHRTNFVAYSEALNCYLTFWTVVMNILLIIAWESVDMKWEYVYDSPDSVSTTNRSLLNRYCVDTVCYNNHINSSIFIPEDCNPSLCVSETLVPSVPDIIDHKHWFFNYTLYIGGVIHLIMSTLMALSYFIRFTPDARLPRLNKAPYNYYLFLLDRDKPLDWFKRKIPRYFKIPLRTFLFESIYAIGFVVCSILSLRYYGYFYCICLLHVVAGNAILRRILKSITKNSFKLFLIVVLALGVIFIYSVAAFAFFANEFDDRDTQYCKSILQCYVTVIHYILIHRSSAFPTNFKDFALRVIIFDVSFYVILIVIGISTISAIVTSTFIELREEWWQIERDRRQICFICQKFSSEFEKKAQGFNHHIFNDHYMFNYVYFKLHIEKVDKDKFNAMEKYYLEKIEAESTDVFPLRTAKCITDSAVMKRRTCT